MVHTRSGRSSAPIDMDPSSPVELEVSNFNVEPNTQNTVDSQADTEIIDNSDVGSQVGEPASVEESAEPIAAASSEDDDSASESSSDNESEASNNDNDDSSAQDYDIAEWENDSDEELDIYVRAAGGSVYEAVAEEAEAEEAVAEEAVAEEAVAEEAVAEEAVAEEAPVRKVNFAEQLEVVVPENEDVINSASEVAPEVAEAAPEVVEAAPVVVEAAPVVVEAAPVVVEAAPVVVEAAPEAEAVDPNQEQAKLNKLYEYASLALASGIVYATGMISAPVLLACLPVGVASIMYREQITNTVVDLYKNTVTDAYFFFANLFSRNNSVGAPNVSSENNAAPANESAPSYREQALKTVSNTFTAAYNRLPSLPSFRRSPAANLVEPAVAPESGDGEEANASPRQAQ